MYELDGGHECQLDVVGARVCGCGSWMYLIVWPRQLDVIGTHEFVLPG